MKTHHSLLPATLLFLLVLAGCTSFSYLTDFEQKPEDSPAPSECGSCHVLQFQEWSGSRHAGAFNNPVFFKAFKEAGDDDCLNCHASIGVVTDSVQPKAYSREYGVDCLSCHYADGTMHGRNRSTALFQPHPVARNEKFYNGNNPCIPCHGETADEYGENLGSAAPPICLECHATRIVRTPSQGTGVFSRALVSFEDSVNTFSHDISLTGLSVSQDQIIVRAKRSATDRQLARIDIKNGLPHNLPTGTYGEKSIRLRIEIRQGGTTVEERVLHIGDEGSPMFPASAKSYDLEIPVNTGADLALRAILERTGSVDSPGTPVRIAVFTIPLL